MLNDVAPERVTDPDMPAAAIEYRDVQFSRGAGPPVLDHFSLQVETGDVLALVGRSGAGKTTLLKLVNRLLLPEAGAVLVEGRDTREWDPISLRRRVGYVLQDVGLFPHMSVADNVALMLRISGWTPDAATQRVHELLDLIGLPADVFGLRWPDELSGGQRQRVGVARALALDPPLLLMDEPFGALDPVTRAELHVEFRRIQDRLGKTVIIVTHDMGEAFALGTRVGVLEAGALVACGPPASIAGLTRSTCPTAARCHPDGSAGLSDHMNRLFTFWFSHSQELAVLLSQHVLLVAASTFAAIAVGLPLGIFASRRPRLAAPLVGIANVVQTIPSLAMFGFLLPAPIVGGVGARAAIVVLTLYGLLPIVRTTIAGLNGIDPSIREAAVAMGMTARERLRIVELPLAAPAIVAGIRVAAVVGVGSATIAAAIGAGGLGEYIYRGLSMVDSTVILAGAIPAALLALSVDGGLLWLERRFVARRRGTPSRKLAAMAAALVVIVVLSSALIARRSSAAIVVGSKNFTEQIILGELVAQTIEREGVAVDRRLNLGGTLICDRALLSGDIDVYVEYTGTALTAIFRQPVANDPRAVFDTVRDLYARSGRTLLPPLGFNNTFAILVRGKDARDRGPLDHRRSAAGWRRSGALVSATSSWSAPMDIRAWRRPTVCDSPHRRTSWTSI